MKIAIHGKMCYGKTTLANIIKEFNNSYEILSFGQKVKDIAKAFVGSIAMDTAASFQLMKNAHTMPTRNVLTSLINPPA